MSRGRALGLAGVLPLYLAMATAVGFVDYQIRPHPDNGFTEYVPQVLAGKADAPGRYRVLAPHAYDRLKALTGLPPLESWLVFRWLCLFTALVVGHVYLRTWFETGATVAGNALVMAVLPLTFTNGWPNPDQFTELALFTLACACIARGWTIAFAVVLVLNAFNRETSAFLLPLFWLAAPLTSRRVVWALALSTVWVAIYIGLRWQLGLVSYDIWQVAQNLERLIPMPPSFPPYYRIYGWFFIILLAPVFWLALRSWREQPRFCRMAGLVVAPAFLIVAFLFSSVIESRIFTPVLSLLVPSMLFTLFAPSVSREP